MNALTVILSVHFGVFLLYCAAGLSEEKLDEDGQLNFTALGRKNGYSVEEHEVVTEDGYILQLFRIKGNRKIPVLLMHGILASADVFIIRGRNSLALSLANAGYDVWAGNVRGSPYSRRHINLDPNIDKQFWNFSFHEMGYYDLAAIIDYILIDNGVNKLNAIGHSQGNTIFYILGSTRPEYNKKINGLGALAPVCYMNNLSTPWNLIALAGDTINEILLALGTEELFDYSLRDLIQNWCTKSKFRAHLCTETLLEFSGRDPQGFEDEFLPVLIGHFPTSSSRKNALHLLQCVISGKFSQFDYGSQGNRQQYGLETPPEYDLSKVTMDIYLFAAKNDLLSSMENVNTLAKNLPNVKELVIITWDKFNHLDFVWGRQMKKYLFPHLMNLLKKYS